MKIKRTIFTTGADGKNGTEEARSEGNGQPLLYTDMARTISETRHR
jgi:hypothetical protein